VANLFFWLLGEGENCKGGKEGGAREGNKYQGQNSGPPGRGGECMRLCVAPSDGGLWLCVQQGCAEATTEARACGSVRYFALQERRWDMR